MTDDELRQRFAELRDEERTSLRSFAAVATARPRRRLRRLVPVAALALIALLAVVLRPRERHEFSPADRVAAQRLAEWSAPTDALLRTPGHELLDSTPDIPSAELPKGVSR